MKGAVPIPSEDQRALKRVRGRPTGPADPLRAADWAFVVILMLFALLFRMHQIGVPSLWADEGASISFAEMDWATLWGVVPGIETNPPLYYALLKAWTEIAGASEAMLRVPGAVAGALAAGGMFLAGHRYFGRGAGIVAGAIVALSAVQVAHAQEARSFAVVSAFVVAALWLIAVAVDRIAENRARRGCLAALAVVLGLLPNLHYSGFFVVLVLSFFVLCLLTLRGGWAWRVVGDIGFVAVIAAVVAGPAILWTLDHMGAGDDPVGWLGPPGFWDAKYVFHQLLGTKHLSFAAPEAFGDMRAAKLLSPRRLAEGTLLLICGVAAFGAWRLRERVVPALIVTLAFVIVLFFGVSQVKPILLERTVLFAVPFVALIAGAGVMMLRDAWFVFPAALVVLAGQGANLAAYYPQAEKENWRATVGAMQSMYRTGDAVVLASGPYLPVSISAYPILRHYWAGELPAPIVTLPSSNAMAMYELGLRENPDLHDAGDGAFCPVFGGATGVVILSRFPEHAEALAEPLAALGGVRAEDRRFGLVGATRWDAIDCP